MSKLMNSSTNTQEDILQASGDNGIDKETAIAIIKKTWRELMKNEQEVGKKIYEYVLLKEITMSVLFINSEIERQSSYFMKMLDIVVGYLDDEATMDQKLSELGAIHNKRYGVKPEHYKHFRTAFMKAIKTYIPWNYQRENAWLWYWNRIIQIMSTSAQKKEPIVSLDITPETATEYIFAIYESFENVTDSPATFGKAFYQALVNGQCEIANLFAKTEFEFQCARIVAKTRHTLFLLDDQATFQEKVMSSAYQYFGHDIKIPQLQLFGEIFIETLKTTNNGQWQPIYSEAWEWLLRLIITVLQIELEDIKKNASKRVLINDDSDNTSSISSKIQLQVTQTGADNTKEKNKKN